MRETIEKRLRERRRDRGPLPSVRELAGEFGASPRTVHLVLRRLAEDGVVHSIHRKGFFWGRSDEGSGWTGESVEERFRAHFLSDLERGTHHPWKELPSRRDLGQIYGATSRCVERVFSSLVEAGILQRRGRRFFPASRPRNNAGGTVLVVVRCDARGELPLDTEREIDFLKSVRKELAERGLALLRIGYHEESGGRFLDGTGAEISLPRIQVPLVGAIVSTWLVQEPGLLLDRLSHLRIPLSAWWEHPAQAFPRRPFPAGLAGFNLSFGESAGTAVGRHLAEIGRTEVAFISPYHGNDWSPARLRGLREQLQARGGAVREFVEPGIHSPWDLRRRDEEAGGAGRLMERVLGRFLDDAGLAGIPTWVVVNDEAAAAMLRLVRDRGARLPHLVGFDNSSGSERLGFDSFEFHTEGMVRRMLHHLGHPGSPIFAKAPLQEMIGRLVVRSSAGLLRR